MRITAVFIGLVILLAPSAASTDESSPANLIHVEVAGLRNSNGDVGCLLFKSADGFPGEAKNAVKAVIAPIHDRAAVCEFSDLPPGDYAVSATHDENSNGKIDTNFLGIPKEGVGTSNDAKGSFGPPKYDDARFSYKGGRQDLTIHLRYLLSL
jgi:uncharacterized protein (DUF2141 family)